MTEQARLAVEEANVRQLLAWVSDARRRVYGIASEAEHVDATLRACEKYFRRQVSRFDTKETA